MYIHNKKNKINNIYIYMYIHIDTCTHHPSSRERCLQRTCLRHTDRRLPGRQGGGREGEGARECSAHTATREPKAA